MSILSACTHSFRKYTIQTLKSHIANRFNHGLDRQRGYNRFNGLNYVKCDFKNTIDMKPFSIAITYNNNYKIIKVLQKNSTKLVK